MNDELGIPGFVPRNTSIPSYNTVEKSKARTSILGAEGLFGSGPRHRRGAAVRLAWLTENQRRILAKASAHAGEKWKCAHFEQRARPVLLVEKHMHDPYMLRRSDVLKTKKRQNLDFIGLDVFFLMVERSGVEPPTPTLRTWCSTN